MSLHVFDHDDGRFRLVRDGREIGWIEDRTIHFHGYTDTAAATHAAATAYAALSRWAARQLRSAPLPHEGRRLAIVSDGGAEWLTLGAARIGRLWRRAPEDPIEDAAGIGFEIDLPARLPASLALSAAHVMDRAIHASGPVSIAESPAAPPSPIPVRPVVEDVARRPTGSRRAARAHGDTTEHHERMAADGAAT